MLNFVNVKDANSCLYKLVYSKNKQFSWLDIRLDSISDFGAINALSADSGNLDVLTSAVELGMKC